MTSETSRVAQSSLNEAVAAMFRRAQSENPAKTFVSIGNKVLTYGDMLDRVSRVASLFANSGLLPGDRMIIATENDEAAIVLFLAALRYGATAIMLDPKTPAPSALPVIAECSARGIALDETLSESWRAAAHPFALKIRTVFRKGALLNRLLRKSNAPANPTDPDSYPAVLDRMTPWLPEANLDPETDAYIMFTSGTTSRPKGVRISRSNLSRHLETLSRQFGYDKESRILDILPLHHVDGLVQGPLAGLWNCACVSRPMQFTIPQIPLLLDRIYAERITHFVAVPAILSMILQFGQDCEESFATEDFRFVISSAARLEEHLWESFERNFGTRIVNFYGLTETVTGGLFCGPDDATRKIGTIGKPVDCEAKIVDETGRELPDGEIGELLLRGGNIMKGYLNDAEGTAAVLKEGWLRTGDLTVRDHEGFFRIVGRKKNLIITGGINVMPDEVSEVLQQHPDVLEAVTFGREDEIWGEIVISCVVLKGNGATPARLAEFCRTRLAPEKVPAKIYTLPALPKGPAGKPVIAEVRRLVDVYSSHLPGSDAADVESSLLRLAAQCFNVPSESLSPGSRQSNTPGWDSLGHLELVVAIEKSFGIRFEPSDIFRMESLRDASMIIHEKMRLE